MVDLNFLEDTINVIGTLMIAYTVIMVHYRFRKEHRIDDKVFLEMRREQAVAIVGVILIVISYVLRNFL